MPTTATGLLVEEGLRVGYQLGDYTLIERIGYGGEAVIWSGWDSRHERVVAIKIIPALEGGSSTISSDFKRQVYLVASLDHPNILPLYEFGSTNDYFYFVMRYCPVGSLRDLLSAGPLVPQDALYLTAQIASALDYLHSHEIVHRDLKPGNILIDTHRRAYLSDFGLAKRLTQETAALHTGRGTAPYAPPEQYLGYRATPQSDIYSLGVLIFEMLTNTLPDSAVGSGSPSIETRRIMPDPREQNPALPPELGLALRRLTAPDMTARPATVREAFRLVAGVFGRELGVPDANSPMLLEKLAQVGSALGDEALGARDARYLLELTQQDWRPDEEEFPLSSTHFALIDSFYSRAERHGLELDDAIGRFMLRGSLAHSFHLDYWWRQVADHQARMQVCEECIATENETVVGRALSQMVADAAELPLERLSPSTLERLIDLAMGASSSSVRSNALKVMQAAAPRSARWRSVGLTPASDAKLTALALSDSPQARQAAHLIGQLRSETAVRSLVRRADKADSDHVIRVLREVRAAAGSLPASAPALIRMRVALGSAREQFLEDKAALSWSRSLIGLAAAALTSLMLVLGFFSTPEAQMRDILLEPYPVSGIVTLVEVNDESLERYGRWASWPRTLHAQLIDRLVEAGAGAIVFDFNFVSETPDDAQLAEAMQRAGNVVQPVTGQGDAYKDTPGTMRYLGGVWPQPVLLEASAALGHTNILHDGDGYVRRTPTVITIEGERYPSIAMAAIHVYLNSGVAAQGPLALPEPRDGVLSFAARDIPVGKFGEMMLHYAGPPAQPDRRTFRTVSYQDVLDGKAPPEAFEDKIVLIGITATAEPDRYLTSVSRGRPMYGAEIQANAIETIWSGRFIVQPEMWVRVVTLLVLGVVTGLVCTRPWLGLVLTMAIAALYFVAASAIFDLRGIMPDLLYPFMTIALSYATVTAYRFSLEARQRRQVMQLFEAHVTPEVARATLSAVQKGNINLEGQVQEVSVMFADIRGYTAYAEMHEPEEVMEMVNTFMNIVVEAVFAYEGTAASYEGDQAMALFNAPLPQPDHAWRAVQAAMEVRRRVEEYHSMLPEDHPHRLINFGCGIYTGKAVVGYAGSSRRYAYTAIGDTVSVAARLTSTALPGQILIGEATYRQIAGQAPVVSLPAVAARGKSEPVAVFAVVPSTVSAA